SIIRTMFNRQATGNSGLLSGCVAVVLGVLLLLNACQSSPTAPTLGGPEPSPPAISTDALIATSTSTAAPAPTQTNAPTPTATQCQARTGTLASVQFESALLGREVYMRIYFPPCYTAQSEKPYPVLYLLHGLEGDETQWESLGLAEELDRLIEVGTAEPMLVVMPRETDTKGYPHSDFPQVFIEELVPFIDSHYTTQTERSGRMIGGISRGASWALRIGVGNYAMFSKVGLHSLPLEFDEGNEWAAELAALEPEDRPALFLDSGHRDKDIDFTRSFEWALTTAGIPHTWYLFSGYHNEAYWSEHLPIYLEWYAQGS
ncbi:MAG: alpha/beta hydrolase-fold protein, partial [Anaerolineaceae bacterium]